MLFRCNYAFFLPILEYCSSVYGSGAECHLQLLEQKVYSAAMLCPDQSFLSLCLRRNVEDTKKTYTRWTVYVVQG